MFYRIIKNKLFKSKNIKNVDALKSYYDNYDYTSEKLKNYFGGEVSILIVDKNYRGRKIGKKLLLNIFELAEKDVMKNLKILTDESCNYKFYENLGCKKVYETIVENKENGKLGNNCKEKAFIYENLINEIRKTKNVSQYKKFYKWKRNKKYKDLLKRLGEDKWRYM